MSQHGPYEDVTKYGFLVEPRYYFYGWSAEPRILGRPSAIRALKRAEAALPKGYRFKIWDFQRPLSVQLQMIQSFTRRMEAAHPGSPPDKIQELVDKFVAQPFPDEQVVRRDCHRNGGAVDLIITDMKGNELYMGTDHDDLTDRAASLYYEKLKNLTPVQEDARRNRQMLREVMIKAGWEMLPSEWWHWSTVE